MTKLKSDCSPSEYSDQPGPPPSLISLRCPHEESLGPYLHTEWTSKTDQTGRMAHSFCWFVMSRLIYNVSGFLVQAFALKKHNYS